MKLIFKVDLDDFIILDTHDILIFSKDEAKHVEHIEEVLQKLIENGLYANVEKSLPLRTLASWGM